MRMSIENSARSPSPIPDIQNDSPPEFGTFTCLSDQEKRLFEWISEPDIQGLSEFYNREYTNKKGQTRSGLFLFHQATANKVLSNQIKAYGFQRQQLNEIDQLRKKIVPKYKSRFDQITEAWKEYCPGGTQTSPLKLLSDRKKPWDQTFKTESSSSQEEFKSQTRTGEDEPS
jgi:vacuolar-type H+-ATPase subunit I/STV1